MNYKFRGLNGDKTEWIYGNMNNLHALCADFSYNGVHKETVGQYIGLKDKNGIEIYEGDILKRESYKHEDMCVIKWDKFRCGFVIDYVYSDESYDMNEFWDDFFIIGNIHDNPELLEKVND